MRGWQWVMNWKECGRKRSWPNLRYYPNICLEDLRKSTKNLSQDSRYPGWDLNPGPPEYDAGVLNCSTPCHIEVSWNQRTPLQNTLRGTVQNISPSSVIIENILYSRFTCKVMPECLVLRDVCVHLTRLGPIQTNTWFYTWYRFCCFKVILYPVTI
jgi:hypothetical protein